MLLLHLLILWMHISCGETEEPAKIKEPLCDSSMKCLAPEKCLNPLSNRLVLTEIFSYAEFDSKCAAIVKFRVYSKYKWIMVLKSFDENVGTITFAQGTATKFECTDVDSKVIAKYNDEEKETLNHSISPLMCEFVVKNETSFVVPDDPKDLTLTAEGHPTFSILSTSFNAQAITTCDPDNVITQEGAVGDKMIVKLEEKANSMDLICPSRYTMKFRAGANDQFKEASALQCKKSTGIYGYSPVTTDATQTSFPSSFEAHCEASQCSLCSEDPPKSDCAESSKFKVTTTTTGCKKLECIKGRLNLESSKNAFSSVECQYINNSFAFVIEGQMITKNANVDCIEKLSCDWKLAQKVCNDCVVDRENRPQCSKGTTLISKNDPVDVVCDYDKGELYVNHVGTDNKTKLTSKDELSCRIPARTDEKKDENTAPVEGSAHPYVIVIGILLFCVIALSIALAYECCQKTKNAKQGERLAKVTVSKEGENSNPLDTNKQSVPRTPTEHANSTLDSKTVSPSPQATPGGGASTARRKKKSDDPEDSQVHRSLPFMP